MIADELIEKLKALAEWYWMISDTDFDSELDADRWEIEVQSYELLVDYTIEHDLPLGSFDIERYQKRNDVDSDDAKEDTWMEDFNKFLLLEYPELKSQMNKGFQTIIKEHEKLFHPDTNGE